LLYKSISEDNEEDTSCFFDHGLDVNIELKVPKGEPNSDGTPSDTDHDWTSMHWAARTGAMNVALALISRGAGVDPTDKQLRTPLMVAIENR
jgi:ankyrin repeat protein